LVSAAERIAPGSRMNKDIKKMLKIFLKFMASPFLIITYPENHSKLAFAACAYFLNANEALRRANFIPSLFLSFFKVK
jgi:hypothetical protein